MFVPFNHMTIDKSKEIKIRKGVIAETGKMNNRSLNSPRSIRWIERATHLCLLAVGPLRWHDFGTEDVQMKRGLRFLLGQYLSITSPGTEKKRGVWLLALQLLVAAFALSATAGEDSRRFTSYPHDGVISYDSFSALPLSDRRRIYPALSARIKSELWRIHLRAYVHDARIPSEGRAAIEDAIELLQPSLFERRGADVAQLEALLASVTERAKDLMPRTLIFEVFYTLGPVRRANEMTVGAHAVMTPPEEIKDCECSLLDSWCGANARCKGAYCIRDDGWPKCGTYWRWDCDGICYPD